MEQIELKATTRAAFRKKTRELRKAGLIPAILYGPRTEPVPLQVENRDLSSVLRLAGTNRLIRLWVDNSSKPRMILARDVQRDTITDTLLHVDLYEVVMTEKITAEIPIILVGEAPVVGKKEGLLVRGIDSVHVHCLPDRLGEAIEVDVSVLEEKDQSILVKDLVLGDDIELLTNPEEVVVKALPLREVVIEEEVEEEVVPAEVEIITAAREVKEEPEEVLDQAGSAEGEDS
jgi:large subunit ribosomal protein L25